MGVGYDSDFQILYTSTFKASDTKKVPEISMAQPPREALKSLGGVYYSVLDRNIPIVRWGRKINRVSHLL